MYGMVNKAVEEMVVKHHGEEMWRRIKEKAGIDFDFFVGTDAYDDAVTYGLIGAASELLGQPAESLLGDFGRHWVLETAEKNYGAMMRAAGDSLPTFLTNLNNLHSRVMLMLPQLRPPSFKVRLIDERSLTLEYYSHRPGLQPFVLGIMQGLGQRFGKDVTCVLATGRHEGLDHDEFLLSW